MAGTWSAGGNLATARHSLAGAGTQSAGLSFGGYGVSISAVTEEYDGTSPSISPRTLLSLGVGT